MAASGRQQQCEDEMNNFNYSDDGGDDSGDIECIREIPASRKRKHVDRCPFPRDDDESELAPPIKKEKKEKKKEEEEEELPLAQETELSLLDEEEEAVPEGQCQECGEEGTDLFKHSATGSMVCGSCAMQTTSFLTRSTFNYNVELNGIAFRVSNGSNMYWALRMMNQIIFDIAANDINFGPEEDRDQEVPKCIKDFLQTFVFNDSNEKIFDKKYDNEDVWTARVRNMLNQYGAPCHPTDFDSEVGSPYSPDLYTNDPVVEQAWGSIIRVFELALRLWDCTVRHMHTNHEEKTTLAELFEEKHYPIDDVEFQELVMLARSHRHIYNNATMQDGTPLWLFIKDIAQF